MQKSLLLIFLFCSICAILMAQGDPEWAIEKIDFQGLKKTKVNFLLPFVKTTINQKLIKNTLEKDLQRLKNIAGIGKAHYKIDTIGRRLHLTYLIEEVRTLLPIFNFGGLKDNFWFQLGFTDINWQGRGQFISAFYQNTDRRHTGQIYYRVPYFRGNKWGFSASISKWASREPLYFPDGTVNYDYDNNSLGLTLIRHLEYHRQLEIGGTYFVEKYRKSNLQFIENPPGPNALNQPKWLAKWVYKEDFINYHFFYQKGISWQLQLQNVYNTFDKSWFYSLQFQGRQFIRIGKRGNVAMRLRLAISTNNETPFAPFVVDSHVNIRGVGNRIDRGTAQAIFNAEYRHTLFDKKLWAAQSVIFSDLGSWRNPGGNLIDIFDSKHFRHFLGGGFRLIYQKIYGAVLRIDYGIDIYNTKQHGFVLGLGQYF